MQCEPSINVIKYLKIYVKNDSGRRLRVSAYSFGVVRWIHENKVI